MPKMIALMPHPFGTGVRQVGEEYDATDDEAKIVTALKWAKKSTGKAEEPEFEDTVADNKRTKAEDKADKSAYQRKDMKAKG